MDGGSGTFNGRQQSGCQPFRRIESSSEGAAIAEEREAQHILVKHVMSDVVHTVDEDTSVDQAARLMREHSIGCVIVTSKEGKPLGIITERDLVTRVLAKNTRPSKLHAKEVMTSPVVTVDPDETLTDAAKRMRNLDITRLVVIYKGHLAGIITSKGIVAVTPELTDIMYAEAEIEPTSILEETRQHPPIAGYCDCCGTWSGFLHEVDGRFLCEECEAEPKPE